MKKIIAFLVLFAGIFLILNLEVTTRQGVNYKVQVLKIPLYLKAMDFYGRNFNYKHLARTIVKGINNPEDRAVKILEWTYANIYKTPQGMPVVDDHVWHIIIRGYGEDDQFQDVFTTLCNYAGLAAFFDRVYSQDGTNRKVFSFVKLPQGWVLFDAYNGIYFRNAKLNIASIEDLISGNCRIEGNIKDLTIDDYNGYIHNFKKMTFENKHSRSSIQSPFRRFLFLFKHNK